MLHLYSRDYNIDSSEWFFVIFSLLSLCAIGDLHYDCCVLNPILMQIHKFYVLAGKWLQLTAHARARSRCIAAGA